MAPIRDDETQAQEDAELDAIYYKALLAKGLSFAAAQRALVARILARRQVAVDADAERDRLLE